MKTLLIFRNIFRITLLITFIFRLFFVKQLSYVWSISSYILLAISLAGMIIFEIIIYLLNKKNWFMGKILYKYSYQLLCLFFIIELFLVLLIKVHIKNELWKMIIDYSFWFSFGLLSGFSFNNYLYKKRPRSS